MSGKERHNTIVITAHPLPHHPDHPLHSYSCPSEKLDQGKIMGKSHTKTGHKIKIKWNLKLDTILFKKNPYLKNNQ